MKEWKYRRLIYYCKGIYPDIDKSKIVYEPDRITERAVEYFEKYDDSGTLYYPAKSYAVAILYALLLEEYFGGSFESYLKDSELLDRDSYFVPYLKDKETYDSILSNIDINKINYALPSIRITRDYFIKEFLLDDHILPAAGKA